MEGIKFENQNDFESDKSKNRKELVSGEKELVGNIEKGNGFKKRILYMGAVVMLSSVAAMGCFKKENVDDETINELKELSTKVELNDEEFNRKLELEKKVDSIAIKRMYGLIDQMEDLGNTFEDVGTDLEEVTEATSELTDEIGKIANNIADKELERMEKEEKDAEEKSLKQMQELLEDKELNDILDSLK